MMDVIVDWLSGGRPRRMCVNDRNTEKRQNEKEKKKIDIYFRRHRYYMWPGANTINTIIRERQCTANERDKKAEYKHTHTQWL